MARQRLLAGILGILAAGLAAEETKLASCRSALAALGSRSPLEASAWCRSALPSETCRGALKDLGAMPWTPDKVASACRKYVPMMASLGASKGRLLDDIADKVKQTGAVTTIDPTTGAKIMTQNPWTPPPQGSSGLPRGSSRFPMPTLFNGKNPPKTPTDQSFRKGGNETFPSMPPLPDSLDPTDCLGSITFAVHELAGFQDDPVFQDAFIQEIAKTGNVAANLITITACHITPFTDSNGIVNPGGNVEVFFKIASGDATRAKAIEQRFAKCNHQEFGYHMWNDMTSRGSNHHTMLIMEGLEAKPVASMRKVLKPAPTVPPAPKLPKLPFSAPFRVPVPPAPAPPPAPTPAPSGLRLPPLASILGKAKAHAPAPASQGGGEAPAPKGWGETPAPKGGGEAPAPKGGGETPLPLPLFTPKAPTAPAAAPKPASPAPLASKLASAAKGLSKLLGKKPAAAPTLLQDAATVDGKKEVVMEAEVHRGHALAKEGPLAATGAIVGAVCVLSALMWLTKAWRRSVFSYRIVNFHASEVPPTVAEALNADCGLE